MAEAVGHELGDEQPDIAQLLLRQTVGELVDGVAGRGGGVELPGKLEVEGHDRRPPSAGASSAVSRKRSRSIMRVISKTRCTSSLPRTSANARPSSRAFWSAVT